MNKKYVNLLLILILTVGTNLSSLSVAFAKESTRESGRSGDKYVTDSWLENSRSEVIDGNKLEIKEIYTLNYEWAIPDNTFKKGDVLEFYIPKEFVVHDISSFPLKENGEEIGIVKIKGNATEGFYFELTFTTDYVETHSNINGNFSISVALNERYVSDGENIDIKYPDKIISTEIIPDDSESVGEGGNGNVGGDGTGAGKPENNEKVGRLDTRDLYNPNTQQFDTPTRVFSWNVGLGRNTLLGKANSFDEIDSIVLEDTLENQKLIGMNEFDGNWPDAFAWKRGFFDTIGFEYGGVSKENMGLIYKDGQDFASSFKMNVLPQILVWEDLAESKNAKTEEFSLEYYSVPIDSENIITDQEFNNNLKITINYKNGESNNWVLEESVIWNVADGNASGKTAAVEFEKIDGTTNNPLDGAQFDLYKVNNQGNEVKVKSGIQSNGNGKVSVTGLTTGNYYFIETKAPNGYLQSEEKLNFTVETTDLYDNAAQPIYKQIGSYKNYEISSKTSINVTKAWNDKEDQDGLRPQSIQVQLYADGEKSGNEVTLNAGNNWTHTWQELDEKNNGKTIEYTVQEVTKVNGYDTTITAETIGNITITNNHTPEVTEVSGTKTWNDKNDQDGIRPTNVTVNLLANGVKVDEQTVGEKEQWAYQFTNLPKYENGQEITYTVTENTVPEYSTEINGFDLTNHYTPGVTSATVTKAWDDKEDQDGLRPQSIQVQLYADGEKSGDEVTLNAGNNWTHTWQELDEKNNGKTIEYTVQEVTKVNGYDTTITTNTIGNITITNNHTPEVTEVSGTKTWNDKNDQDGIRPTNVTVNLLANGVKVDEQTVGEKEKWAYQFTNLPKYENGQEITYTVTENTVPEYSTEINGFDLTNHYTPGVTSATVTKAWDDKEDQDGLRPQSIQVQLYADGEKSGDEVTLNAGNNWTHTWQELDEKNNGKTIEYTVQEVTKVNGYDTTITAETIGNIIITNSHTPEVTEVSGTKTWNDKNDQDGIRPTNVTVNLLANGVKVDEQTVGEKEQWAYQFTNLPKYENGQEITYTVTENKVPEYSTEINGFDLTNHYTPGVTSATVTKAWDDKEDQDGLRPQSIQVQLYADGEKSGNEVTLNAGNNWTHTWQELDEKNNGKTIEYTVQEVTKVNGYDTTITAETIGNIIITNSHTPKEKETTNPNNNSDDAPKGLIAKLGEKGSKTIILIGLILIIIVASVYIERRAKKI